MHLIDQKPFFKHDQYNHQIFNQIFPEELKSVISLKTNCQTPEEPSPQNIEHKHTSNDMEDSSSLEPDIDYEETESEHSLSNTAAKHKRRNLRQDCNSPPWSSTDNGDWECEPARPPYHECTLRCKAMDNGIFTAIPGTQITWTCDENSKLAWNISKKTSCIRKFISLCFDE